MKTLLSIALLAFGSVALAADIPLTWTDNSSDEDAFILERSTDGQTFAAHRILPPDTEQVIDTLAEVGQEYHYRVRAVNQYGHSGYTNVAIGAAKGPPLAPSDAVAGETAPTLRITVNDDGTISIENL